MKAKITREFRCAPEGHTVVTYRPGEIVSGAVAEWAIAANAAARVDTPVESRKIVDVPERKPRVRK